MNRIRKQTGQPTIEEADYRGYRVKVVCGYNVQKDNYAVHLYISPPGGPEIRVFEPPKEENSEDDALDFAFATAQTEIDQLIGV